MTERLADESERRGQTREQRLGAARREHGVVHTSGVVARAVVREADLLLRALALPPIGDGRLHTIEPSIGAGIFAATLAEHCAADAAPLTGIDLDGDVLAELGGMRDRLASRGWRLSVRHENALTIEPRSLAGPTTLVIGNPPWAARNATEVPGSDAQLADFRVGHDGAPLGERRDGVLSDAYVRFVRWAAEVVRESEAGVLALVLNGSFLEGPVHRGMRAALTRWFDELRVIDLGGSALIAHARRDANVLGVRPSVAVLLAGRRRRSGSTPRAAVASLVTLRGTLAEKERALATPLRFTSLARSAEEPLGAPVPSWPAGWVAIDEIVPFHAEGVQTNRDELVLATDRETLRARLTAFAQRGDDRYRRAHFDEDRARARAGAAELPLSTLAYRPFDRRFAALDPALCHRPRPELARAMASSSWALLTVPKDLGDQPAMHFACVDVIAESSYLSSRSTCRTRVFPSHTPAGLPNVADGLRALFPTPTSALAYVASWLGLPSYWERAGTRLRRGLARVPDPRAIDGAVRERAIAEGEKLAAAWLGAQVGGASWRVGHRPVSVDAATERRFLSSIAALESLHASSLAELVPTVG